MPIKTLPTASYGMRYPEFFPKTRNKMEEGRQLVNERIDALLDNTLCPLAKKILKRVLNVIK